MVAINKPIEHLEAMAINVIPERSPQHLPLDAPHRLNAARKGSSWLHFDRAATHRATLGNRAHVKVVSWTPHRPPRFHNEQAFSPTPNSGSHDQNRPSCPRRLPLKSRTSRAVNLRTGLGTCSSWASDCLVSPSPGSRFRGRLASSRRKIQTKRSES